jgi:hypothetical protein
MVPGDDVFVAADLGLDDDDPGLLVFDWREPVPRRWVVVGTLSGFVEKLRRFQQYGPARR